MNPKVAVVAWLATCLVSSTALAHPEGFSGMHVKVEGGRIRVEITIHTRDMGAWFPPAKYPDYVADVTREMERTIAMAGGMERVRLRLLVSSIRIHHLAAFFFFFHGRHCEQPVRF